MSVIKQQTGESKQRILDTFPEDYNKLHLIMAKMAAGEDVKIACYGDSTTDGINTTNHKKITQEQIIISMPLMRGQLSYNCCLEKCIIIII